MRGPRKTVKASSMQRRLCQTGLADAPKVELVLRPLRLRLMLLRCPTDAAQSNGRHSRGTAGGRRRGRRRLRAAGLQALPNSGWATRIRTLADGFGAGLSAAELRDLYVQRGGRGLSSLRREPSWPPKIMVAVHPDGRQNSLRCDYSAPECAQSDNEPRRNLPDEKEQEGRDGKREVSSIGDADRPDRVVEGSD